MTVVTKPNSKRSKVGLSNRGVPFKHLTKPSSASVTKQSVDLLSIVGNGPERAKLVAAGPYGPQVANWVTSFGMTATCNSSPPSNLRPHVHTS